MAYNKIEKFHVQNAAQRLRGSADILTTASASAATRLTVGEAAELENAIMDAAAILQSGNAGYQGAVDSTKP